MKYKGLSQHDVIASRKQYGSNELSPIVIESFWKKLYGNFNSPIILILIVALFVILGLSFFDMTEWYEAVAIGVAVLLATGVSTFSEFKNESSFQRLQEEASLIKSKVFRNGELTEVMVNDIVTNDIVLLQAGDKIPADGKIVSGSLKVNQASLTGEFKSVSKIKWDGLIEFDKNDLINPYSLFRGTVVEEGEAVMEVENVGDRSFYGKMAKELSITDDRLSPLQVKLKDLAVLISKFGYTAAILIAITFSFNKIVIQNNFDGALISQYLSNWETLINDIVHAVVLAIIIVVAAIPEGLPMMIAIVLSLNMQKMLREKVLVRKLLGIETAGSLNILFTDKTGTLTKGQLDPKFFMSGTGEKFNSYKEVPEKLKAILRYATLCNTDSYLSKSGEITGGNTSEKAILSFIKSEIMDSDPLEFDVKEKIHFNSSLKFSATEVSLKAVVPYLNTSKATFVKGAPEILLEKVDSFIDENGAIVPINNKDTFIQGLDELADSGIRLIAMGYSEKPINGHDFPDSVKLVGIIGLQDGIREESVTSVREVKEAGIQVVMITGDRKGTARAIAVEAGLVDDENNGVLVSSELNNMTDEEIKEILPNLRAIARALPTDKSRMVRISKTLGKVVGMTGDGVNDSIALKQSDVGIAMGSGSEVSKEAGDIVILDDNFYSISNAIRYGRTIFKSIRKFIVFQLTVNVAAVSLTFLGPLLGIDFPLTIIQILWINMIMDTLAAIAFGGEPALHRYMKEE
ncbi:MAG: HAD-IC family P-type ATPase, partial [Cyclobacteriaceae bacterium]|nr:HAD-IC family P-type ATPase [Cyclobacteriaceae bacterium]